MSKVIAVQTINEFKAELNISSLEVRKSLSSGKRFVRVQGERIGLAENCELNKPMVVITMEDDTAEWRFITNEKEESSEVIAQI